MRQPLHAPESGSLVLGLALLVSFIALGALFLVSALHKTALFQHAAQRRSDVLTEKSRQTQALNRIASNNSLILVLLSEALEGYAEATLAATAFQSSVPFWLSEPMAQNLTQQEPVEHYFGAASQNFALRWRRAFSLNQDSKNMITTLTAAHPGWRAALYPVPSTETFCLAMKILASKKASLGIRTAQALSTLRIHYDLQQRDRCAIRIQGISGQWSVFDAQKVLHLARIPKTLEVTIVAMGKGAPLEQAVHKQSVTWEHSPLTLLRGTTHTLELQPASVRLIHPRLHQSRIPPFGTLLEPHWVPVYVTSQLGG